LSLPTSFFISLENTGDAASPLLLAGPAKVLLPEFKTLERGAGPAHLHVGFGQSVVDLLVYRCRVRSDEGFDLEVFQGIWIDYIPPTLFPRADDVIE
jgi:hypothetical protein